MHYQEMSNGPGEVAGTIGAYIHTGHRIWTRIPRINEEMFKTSDGLRDFHTEMEQFIPLMNLDHARELDRIYSIRKELSGKDDPRVDRIPDYKDFSFTERVESNLGAQPPQRFENVSSFIDPLAPQSSGNVVPEGPENPTLEIFTKEVPDASGLSSTAVAIIVIGTLFLVPLIGVIWMWCKRHKQPDVEPDNGETPVKIKGKPSYKPIERVLGNPVVRALIKAPRKWASSIREAFGTKSEPKFRRRLAPVEAQPIPARLADPNSVLILVCISQVMWIGLGYFLFRRYRATRKFQAASPRREGIIPLYD